MCVCVCVCVSCHVFLSVQRSSGGVVGPGMDEVVELGAGTGGLPHIPVTFQGVGGRDHAIIQPALDQLPHRVESRLVGHLAGEVADHTDG